MTLHKKRLAEIINKYLASQDNNLSWLAKRLNVAPSTVKRWTDGETFPRKREYLIQMVNILHIHDKAEREFMLGAIRYDNSEPQLPETHCSNPEATTASISSNPWLEGLERQLHSGRALLRRAGAWEVQAIRLLRRGMIQVTPQQISLILLPIGIWWLTNVLVASRLNWSLNSTAAQQAVSVKYGIATLLIPLLITFLVEFKTSVNSPSRPRVDRDWLLLEFTGALVGFGSVSLLMVGVSLLWAYSPNWPALDRTGWWLVLFPLLASYIAARSIPVMRSELNKPIFFQPVDRLILLVFLLLGPLSAAFLYFEREMLRDRAFGVIFFVVFLGWMLWEAKKRDSEIIPEWFLILAWGAVVPGVVLFVPLWMPGILTPQHMSTVNLLIFAGYIVGQCLMTATLYVKKQARLFWPLLIFIITMELLTILVLTHHTVWGLWFLAGLGLLFLTMMLLAQKRLHAYLWIHKSFWIMQIMFITSLWAWSSFLGWTSILLYSGASAILIGWAANLRTLDNLPQDQQMIEQ